ncbi:hypothetical protein WISP_61681 [Willisornis vidua]|uniref:Endonuclease/exonuclease/phosphatase domain-containing protein n=1 Tax=Willisornis vidua TaxID=1566151 RepID=A0ABQ9DB15_9PASS|nr:hypothetical protein WISP_61681 [Willisornis vidua]
MLLVVFQGKKRHVRILEGSTCHCSAIVAAAYAGSSPPSLRINSHPKIIETLKRNQCLAFNTWDEDEVCVCMKNILFQYWLQWDLHVSNILPHCMSNYEKYLILEIPAICVNLPILDPVEKDKFYTDLRRLTQRVSADDKIIILGDFNARVGKNSEAWKGVPGKHDVGNFNDNGHLLLEFCAEQQLTMTNTITQQKDSWKTTWMHPQSKHWHLIDCVLAQQRNDGDAGVTIIKIMLMRMQLCWAGHISRMEDHRLPKIVLYGELTTGCSK